MYYSFIAYFEEGIFYFSSIGKIFKSEDDNFNERIEEGRIVTTLSVHGKSVAFHSKNFSNLYQVYTAFLLGIASFSEETFEKALIKEYDNIVDLENSRKKDPSLAELKFINEDENGTKTS